MRSAEAATSATSSSANSVSGGTSISTGRVLPDRSCRERLADQPGNLARRHRPLGALGDVPDHAELVADLVEHAAAVVDQVGPDLTGHAEDRRVAGVGGRERGGRVQQTRSGHDHADAFAAGDPRVAVGHVGGRLLVAGVDDAEPVAARPERVEEAVELDARQTEERIDAIPDQHVGQGIAAGHALRRHCRFVEATAVTESHEPALL